MEIVVLFHRRLSLGNTKKGVLMVKKVLESLQKENGRKRINVIKMEIDYELLTLHDAIKAGDKEQIEKSKERLSELRDEWVMLEKV